MKLDLAAFATGSYRYGKPSPKSDFDLVVFAHDAQICNTLKSLCDEVLTYNNEVSFSFRFGKLNLLVFLKEEFFNAWNEAAAALEKQAPVTRKRAVEVIHAFVQKAKRST